MARHESAWRPRGLFAWLLTLGSLALAAIATTLACCMAFPVRWSGLGKLGALLLFFPLHLLLVTLAAAGLALLARLIRARLASRVFSAVALLTALMALLPPLAVWQKARQWNVPLSLGEYLASARHMNTGLAQRERSIVYGTSKDGVKLELDVWRSGLPDAGPLRPAILMIHGGAWNHGNRSMLPDWNRWLNGLGYEVFDVEYRMPPPVRWLDEIGDVKTALGWVAAHAAEYHVDPARITLMGGSAGGNLSLLAGYTVGEPSLPASTDVPAVAVRSIVNFYGPSDMVLAYRTCKDPGYVRPLMQRYIGGTPDEQPERYRALSPLSWIDPSDPPTLTLTGTSDRLVSPDHATLLDDALAKAGVPHETYLLPATDHGFDVNWGGFGAQVARAKIEVFLRQAWPGR